MHAAQRARAKALLVLPPLLLLAGAVDGGDEVVARSPEALAAWARAHSPRARAAALESKAAVRAADGAGTFFDPMLEARAAPLSVPGLLPVDPHDEMGVGVELMVAQRLPLSARLAREHDRARALGERARAMTDAALLDIERAAALLSCSAWEAVALKRERERLVEVLRTMAEITRAQIASGRATVGDAQRVDAELVRLTIDLVESEGERAAIDADTNALLGRPPDAPLAAPPERVPLLGPAPFAVDVAARDEVRASAALLAASEAERARAADAWIPDLTAKVGWSSMWPVTHQLMLGVAVDLPVFNGGRSAEQDSASIMREGASAALDDVKARAVAELAAARARDQAAATMRALFADQVVPLVAARAETARAALSGGAALDAALDATREERAAHIELLRATAAQCRSRADHWRATGLSFLTNAPSPELP